MPYLRFTRDARGYENTCLVHAIRRHGKSRARILYWFRTPPNVRVGRAPLDEEAIKAIETSNPDVAFDWQKILEAQPPVTPPPDPRRPDRRARRRDRSNAPPAQGPAAEPGRPPMDARGPSTVETSAPADHQPHEAREAEESAPRIDGPLLAAGDGDDGLDIIDTEGEGATEADAGTEAWRDPGGTTDSDGGAAGIVRDLVGAEGLARLRSRFAEIQARISECALDAAAIEELRRRADVLNPDTWVTLDEARAGLDEYERRLDEVRRTLGPPRRRSRRGGRRRNRRSGGASSSTAGASGAPHDSPEPANRDNTPDGRPVD